MTTLWLHQRKALNNIIKRLNDTHQSSMGYGLFFEQGTGKTLTAIRAMEEITLGHEKTIKTLIVCPLIVVRNWQREIHRFSEKVFSPLTAILEGQKGQRVKTWEKNQDKTVWITNIDSATTDFWRDYIAKSKWDILILDECHKVKNPDAKRTKAIHSLADRIPYKLILSGTPILNSLLDIWGQFRVLSPYIFPENYFVFRRKYFEDKNAWMPKVKYFPNWQPKQNTIKTLEEVIKQHSLRVLKSEAIDLPPLVRQKVYVQMGEEQTRIYREMSDSFITYIQEEAVTATIALTKVLRLMQICCGLAVTTEGSLRKIETKKLEALKELLTDITPNHKVIVWANFIASYEDIADICKDINVRFSMIRGGQHTEDRQKEIDRFENDLETRVMIANQQAGGIGINLTAASYMIYYSKNFNLENDLQSEARAYRSGSERHESITRIDIITEDTIEELVTEALQQKKELSELILDIKRKAGNDGTTNDGMGKRNGRSDHSRAERANGRILEV